VPLVANDPYFSIWSPANELHAKNTVHWTGKPQAINSLIRIDGQAFRLMGEEPRGLATLPQTALQVCRRARSTNSRTRKVAVTLTFTTPALPNDIDVLSRPLTYLTWDVRSADGAAHEVQLYADASGELTVNELSQEIRWDRPEIDGLVALRFGSQDQPMLAKKGDDLRIDWGHLYIAAAKPHRRRVSSPRAGAAMEPWIETGKLPDDDSNRDAARSERREPRRRDHLRPRQSRQRPALAAAHARLRRRVFAHLHGPQAAPLLASRRHGCGEVARDRGPRISRVAKALHRLRRRTHGRSAQSRRRKIRAHRRAAHRQALAANKVVADANGAPLMFSKENFFQRLHRHRGRALSRRAATAPAQPDARESVDHPAAQLRRVAALEVPFAPHDLGTYPRADGQVYGGGERTEQNQMPVEESGNVLILLAAVAKIDGDAKFSEPFWPQISAWAKYLESKGFDPENQLCTDDFAGHLAHNVNLSAESDRGARRLTRCSAKCAGKKPRRCAWEMSRARWPRAGCARRRTATITASPSTSRGRGARNTISFGIAFLGLKLFPAEVMREEMAFYRTKLNRYGLPLDSRKTYTKLDWTVWTATLTGSRDDFESLVAPKYDFLNDTPQRNPMTDWHETTEPKQVGFPGALGRGGVFIPMLADAALWKKWADRDREKNGARRSNGRRCRRRRRSRKSCPLRKRTPSPGATPSKNPPTTG
jgi:hypothetical protein